jgi:hypothetical protein
MRLSKSTPRSNGGADIRRLQWRLILGVWPCGSPPPEVHRSILLWVACFIAAAWPLRALSQIFADRRAWSKASSGRQAKCARHGNSIRWLDKPRRILDLAYPSGKFATKPLHDQFCGNLSRVRNLSTSMAFIPRTQNLPNSMQSMFREITMADVYCSSGKRLRPSSRCCPLGSTQVTCLAR